MVINDPAGKGVSFPEHLTESLAHTVTVPVAVLETAPISEKVTLEETVVEVAAEGTPAPIVEETPAPIIEESTPVVEEVAPVLEEATPTPEVVAPVEEKPTETVIYSAPSTVTSAVDPHTKLYSHINGSAAQLLDRLAVAELCKGWPVYRDASEWSNYRDLFTEDGTVWTTWSGPRHISDFISISQAGKKSGVFIMHRECGTLTELSRTHPNRAIGKMKATITHRFTFPESQFDVDCDCRFIFFAQRNPETGEWKARYVKLFYEKDKVVPVDGRTAPVFEMEELERYPAGYCYLGAAQARLGYEIDVCLPTPFNGGLYERMYGEMEKWLDGKEIDLFWEGK